VGDQNQITYLQKFLPKIPMKTVLEVGSRGESNAIGYRKYFPDSEYVGSDLQPGENVDIVQDLTLGTGDIPIDYFDLIICCSVFEHVSRPWLAAENLAKLSKTGGILYFSVPWIWRYHAYPNDYFRYSPSSFPILFPDYTWEKFHISTRKPNEIIEINPHKLMGFDTKLSKDGWLPYMMVNSLGTKI